MKSTGFEFLAHESEAIEYNQAVEGLGILIAQKQYASMFEAKDKAQKRNSHLKQKYNITLTQYYAMLAKQRGGCAICQTQLIEKNGKNLAVDHCHKTGKVRGILCNSCNNRIAVLENEEFCLKAMFYLGEYQ